MRDTSILTALRGTVAGAGAGVVWPGDPHGSRTPAGPVGSRDGGRLPPDLPVASSGGAGAPSLSLSLCCSAAAATFLMRSYKACQAARRDLPLARKRKRK